MGQSTIIEAVPLTPEAFAPFGDVIENPRPDVHPSSADKQTPLPFAAVVANQGSAIKYQHVSRQINLYDQAPSGRQGSTVMNMFVCAARARIPDPPPQAPAPAPAPAPAQTSSAAEQEQLDPPHAQPSTFPLTVLERHPYTTQTFIPLTADPAARYLVIVAPSLPPDDLNNAPPSSKEEETQPLPVPASLPHPTDYPRPLPGAGMPDLRRVRAFVASAAAQAVTYGAGTWHAPMVALGEEETAVDFVVVQFANGVGVEDCQEVFLREGGLSSARDGVGQSHDGGLLVVLRPLTGPGGGEVGGEGKARL